MLYLFGPAVGLLHNLVEQRMRAEGLDQAWLTSMPYTVASCAEFETISPTIALVGIQAFFSRRFAGDLRSWMLQEFAKESFPDEYGKTSMRIPFKSDWAKIFPPQVLPFSS